MKPVRFKDYFLTMPHAEENQRLSNATDLPHLYLKDGFNRLQSQDNVEALFS